MGRVTMPIPVNRAEISHRRSSAHNSGLLVILSRGEGSSPPDSAHRREDPSPRLRMTGTLGAGVQPLKQATTGIRDAWSLPERSWAVEMDQCRPKQHKQSHSIRGGHTNASD